MKTHIIPAAAWVLLALCATWGYAGEPKIKPPISAVLI